MTTWNVAGTAGYRVSLEDLKNAWYTVKSWVANARANYEKSKVERWNREHLALLQSYGMSPYK